MSELGISGGSSMTRVSGLVVVICAIVGMAGVSSAQQGRMPTLTLHSQPSDSAPDTEMIGDAFQRQQVIAANAQRQIEIRRDTEKMLQLTQQLQADLLKSSSAVMSLDALKKAQEIEKLAKSVKSKMKQSF
jgi:hypothetical protein